MTLLDSPDSLFICMFVCWVFMYHQAAGAVGLKLHEDWGTTPAAIDCCLRVADEEDIQVVGGSSGRCSTHISVVKGWWIREDEE